MNFDETMEKRKQEEIAERDSADKINWVLDRADKESKVFYIIYLNNEGSVIHCDCARLIASETMEKTYYIDVSGDEDNEEEITLNIDNILNVWFSDDDDDYEEDHDYFW